VMHAKYPPLAELGLAILETRATQVPTGHGRATARIHLHLVVQVNDPFRLTQQFLALSQSVNLFMRHAHWRELWLPMNLGEAVAETLVSSNSDPRCADYRLVHSLDRDDKPSCDDYGLRILAADGKTLSDQASEQAWREHMLARQVLLQVAEDAPAMPNRARLLGLAAEWLRTPVAGDAFLSAVLAQLPYDSTGNIVINDPLDETLIGALTRVAGGWV
jgi:hypothetical protein